jgi:hypothetical protein
VLRDLFLVKNMTALLEINKGWRSPSSLLPFAFALLLTFIQ